jgi:hypothetical protein
MHVCMHTVYVMDLWIWIWMYVWMRKKKERKKMRRPGIEPGSNRWQRSIITTRPATQRVDSGGAGHRSPCLVHAKHTLCHLSYTPYL